MKDIMNLGLSPLTSDNCLLQLLNSSYQFKNLKRVLYTTASDWMTGFCLNCLQQLTICKIWLRKKRQNWILLSMSEVPYDFGSVQSFMRWVCHPFWVLPFELGSRTTSTTQMVSPIPALSMVHLCRCFILKIICCQICLVVF